MKLAQRHHTPLFADNGQTFVREAERWINNVTSPTKRRYRLNPADELEMLQEIMLRVQAGLRPQTTWLSPDPRDTTEKVLRWDGPRATNRLELRARPSVTDGGLTFILAAGFLPEVADFEAEGHGFSGAMRLAMQARNDRKLCFWHLAPITEISGLSKREQHLGQMDIFRLDDCGSNQLHMEYLDHKAACLDGKERYLPDYFYSWQRPRRGQLVADIIRVTQDSLVAAGIA